MRPAANCSSAVRVASVKGGQSTSTGSSPHSSHQELPPWQSRFGGKIQRLERSCCGGRPASRAVVIVTTPCGKFTFKERALMGFAWTPKATVQAAVGSMVLDRAAMLQLHNLVSHGIKVLTCCVASILLTAPIGSILMTRYGKIWLTKANLAVTGSKDFNALHQDSIFSNKQDGQDQDQDSKEGDGKDAE